MRPKVRNMKPIAMPAGGIAIHTNAQRMKLHAMNFSLHLGLEVFIFLLPIDSDQPRPPGGRAELLKYWAMWSVNMIDDLRDIKGVALWMTGSALSSNQ